MPEQQTASPDEIERMMRNLCAYALSEPDPLQRYLNLTHQQAVFSGVVAALQAERGKALADMADDGAPLDRIVADAGLSTAAVRSLVKAADRKLPRGNARASASGKAAAAATGAGTAKSRAPRMPTLPSTSRATNGSRVLTPEERAVLGLPATGSLGVIPRQRGRG